MLDQLRTVIDGIPLAIVAFSAPPAIWAKAAWASPFLKTYRHGISGLLSLLTGLLMAASIVSDDATFPIFLVGAATVMVAMLAALLWPPERKVP